MKYQDCVENSLVVSEVFCLPADYRKDVPPPSKELLKGVSQKSLET